jgi:hypothetical protein
MCLCYRQSGESQFRWEHADVARITSGPDDARSCHHGNDELPRAPTSPPTAELPGVSRTPDSPPRLFDTERPCPPREKHGLSDLDLVLT